MNESNQNFARAVAEIIENDLSFDLAHYSPQLKSFLDEWEGSHPKEKYPSPVLWELVALDAMPDLRKERNLGEPYFRPKVEIVDRDTDPPSMRIYPDVQGTLSDDNAIEYYQMRFQETQNIIRKARYADLLWEALRARNDRSAYHFAIEAANAYLSQLPLYLQENGGFTHLVNNLKRVAEISVTLNAPDLAVNAVKCIADTLPYLLAVDGYYYISEIIETLDFIGTKVHDSVSPQLWHQVREISLQAITSLEQQKPLNNLFVQAMVEVVVLSSIRLGDEKMAWDYRVRIAEIHENEANTRENGEGAAYGSLVALKFMEDAFHTYRKLVSLAPNEEERTRIIGKVEEKKREVRRLIRQAEEEMQPISVSVEVPKDQLENYIKPLLASDSDSVLTLLSIYPDLTPDISELHDQARQMAEEAPLTSILGKTHLRDGRIVDETPPFSNEDAFVTQLGFWFQTHATLLDYVFYRLRETDKISSESILAHLKAWEFLDERDLPFLEKALVHYFSDDHVSALHILVPRIEHMLKSVFEQVGMPSVAVPNERQIREQTFGDFLHRVDVKKVLSESIWHYLYFALVGESGLNLRNDIAHGWIKIESCNRITVQIGIYCMLLLTRLHIDLPDKS